MPTLISLFLIMNKNSPPQFLPASYRHISLQNSSEELSILLAISLPQFLSYFSSTPFPQVFSAHCTNETALSTKLKPHFQSSTYLTSEHTLKQCGSPSTMIYFLHLATRSPHSLEFCPISLAPQSPSPLLAALSHHDLLTLECPQALYHLFSLLTHSLGHPNQTLSFK